MRNVEVLAITQFLMLCFSAAVGQGNPADCTGLAGQPLFSLKAVAINGTPVTPTNVINAMPGDIVDAEVFVSCWGSVTNGVRIFEATVLTHEGATSGTSGMILPQGWDAPLVIDFCPCDDLRYPICDAYSGCVGAQYHSELSATLDVDRPDYLLANLEQISAVSVVYGGFDSIRFGGTAVDRIGVPDDGQVRYVGSLHLIVGDDACGEFTFDFLVLPEPNPESNIHCYDTFVCDAQPAPHCFCPTIESLAIRVCVEDGLYCNGTLTCDPEAGCQNIPPPSCDDGVACTVDSCDEEAKGCVHLDDQCSDIPTTSTWGLAVLALCLMIVAKVRFRTRLA